MESWCILSTAATHVTQSWCGRVWRLATKPLAGTNVALVLIALAWPRPEPSRQLQFGYVDVIPAELTGRQILRFAMEGDCSPEGAAAPGAVSPNESVPKNTDGEGITSPQYVMALDVGTSVLRCHIYNNHGFIVGASSRKLEIEHPKPGWFEIDPLKLFDDSCAVVKSSLAAAGLQASQVTSMGIATQRNTFVTWDRETGEVYHKMITWQDLRASEAVASWNSSYTLKALNKSAKLLHFFTRRNRHKAASVLKFMSKQVTMRLLWVLTNIANVKQRAFEGKVMFGCIETWLLWKLSGKKLHATDYSCASTTGIFDPYSMEWSPIVCSLVDIPMSMLPEIRDTSGDFGTTEPDLFGAPIPIKSLVADQQGSMFGQCCFYVGDIKCTMGTGTFIDMNTGKIPHASIAGLYPLVGWSIGGKATYLAEGHSADTGNVMDWAKSIGLLDDVTQSSNLASSVPDSGGVCFLPAYSGLQAPLNDDKACTTMFGLKLSTTKAHLVRAMLESMAFRFKILYETFITETKIPLSCICADGGVSTNDFLLQLMADVTNQSIERSADSDMTSRGAAFLAGLAAGVWKSQEELKAMKKTDKMFEPADTWSKVRFSFYLWERAVSRSLNWYR